MLPSAPPLSACPAPRAHPDGRRDRAAWTCPDTFADTDSPSSPSRWSRLTANVIALYPRTDGAREEAGEGPADGSPRLHGPEQLQGPGQRRRGVDGGDGRVR